MKFSSLSYRFFLYVVSLVLLSQVLLVSWAYRLERAAMESDLRAKIEITAGLMVSSAEKALAEFDVTNVGLLMDKALKDRDFVSIRLFDQNRYPVMERNGRGQQLHTVEFPVTRGVERIGTLEIIYSTSRIQGELVARVLSKMLMMGTTLCALAAVILFFFRRRVVLRVVEIDNALSRIASGDLTVTLEDSREDELSHIAAGINSLTGEFARSIGRFADLSDQVFQATGELITSFEETSRAMNQQYRSTEDISSAVGNVSQSQSEIARSTEKLYRSAEENSTATRQAMEISRDIARRIDLLDNGMNEAHASMASLDAATRKVAALAVQATEHAVSAGTTAGDVRSTITAVSELVDACAEETERTTNVICEKGIPSFNEADRSMIRIHSLSESLGRTISDLGAGSKNIAKILAVISDVTERTKLLSLNASIIAAQTGEHGKGFAVVAQEMKLLSEQTALSTKEIVDILSSIQDGIGEAVDQTRETARTVEEGRGVVSHAGEALNQILDASRSSNHMVREMTVAATIQQEKLEQIVTAMGHLRDLNAGVSRAMTNEQANISEVSVTIGELCSSMDEARRDTDRQVRTMEEMMENLRVATGQISDIAREAGNNEETSRLMAQSVQDVVSVTARTTEFLNAASGKLTEVVGQTERLTREMKRFRTAPAQRLS